MLKRQKDSHPRDEVDLGWRRHFQIVLGISKSRYYNKSVILKDRDKLAIEQIKLAHNQHPFYGVRRLSLHLGWSKNKTRRIRTIANIAVPTTAKRYKYPRANKAEITAPPNILHNYATLKNINKPQDGLDYSNMANAEAWVQDFTYIKHSGSFCYLAIVMSIKTREVIGWRLGTNH